MTVQEAISIIKSIRKEYEKKKFGVEAIDISIQSMEEVEQYRALGTVEELREASEKQIPKKPIVECFSMGYRRCPNCNEYFDCDEDYYLENGEWHYCGKCGQAIDWGEEDE